MAARSFRPHCSALSGLALLAALVVLSGLTCPINLGPLPPGNEGLTGDYVGSERCSDCHSTIHNNWLNTLHAGALNTLEEIGQDTNESCIGCHVVGFGEPGGFTSRALTDDLAGVGCEACHGPGRAHASNAEDESLRPVINLTAEVCGRCHTGDHHPNFDDWLTAGHSLVTESPASDFEEGEGLNSCGKCHSGYMFYYGIIKTQTVPDDALAGVAREDQLAVECVMCHNPHQRTGNAPETEDGRDYQLRFPEIANPTPTNTIDATTNAARFNICGQCHHSRGRDWTSNSRGPHHSIQANFYTGEMPMPASDDPTVVPLVPSRTTRHAEANEQCATCHMFRQDFASDQAPAISGHTFQVNLGGCLDGVGGAGCHAGSENLQTRLDTFQTEIETGISNIVARLNTGLGAGNWEYSSEGGPGAADQNAIPENVRKVRFLIAYLEADGSRGVHNFQYARDILEECDNLLDDEGL